MKNLANEKATRWTYPLRCPRCSQVYTDPRETLAVNFGEYRCSLCDVHPRLVPTAVDTASA
jgi:predicted SprT family Zn-dependent metalloprotease